MTSTNTIQLQVLSDINAGKPLVRALGNAIFNHGPKPVREAFNLPAAKIRDLFYRGDCFKRCQLAARQMLERAAKTA